MYDPRFQDERTETRKNIKSSWSEMHILSSFSWSRPTLRLDDGICTQSGSCLYLDECRTRTQLVSEVPIPLPVGGPQRCWPAAAVPGRPSHRPSDCRSTSTTRNGARPRPRPGLFWNAKLRWRVFWIMPGVEIVDDDSRTSAQISRRAKTTHRSRMRTTPLGRSAWTGSPTSRHCIRGHYRPRESRLI